MNNQCMMQYFEWNIPADGLLWQRVAAQAESLKSFGVDIVWLPPAYKGANGGSDVGYAVYDLYDLGEFEQRGSVRTKYGTKDEYLACIKRLQKHGISVIADIVLNHRIGADGHEKVMAEMYNPENRNQQTSGEIEIDAWTKFSFPKRAGKYSTFEWDASCFTGVDWDEKTKKGGIYRLAGKKWSGEVDDEKGNFDYLMGADVDLLNEKVVEELANWGQWYFETTGIDGVRLDAVKHMDADFYENWLNNMRKTTGRDLFALGEYWSNDLGDLQWYLRANAAKLSLFDVPLHMHFRDASAAGGNYGMQRLFENTLVTANIFRAVTFVDNHDSQPGQSLQSWVEGWFKPLAYAAILLRKDGLPCVFYADYYGLRDSGIPPVPGLKRMMAVRRDCAYGQQHDYFDHDNIVGWTRSGDKEHKNSGCAVLMSDGPGGEKTMFMGENFAGAKMRDIMCRVQQPVIIGEDGNGVFSTPGGAVTVWVTQEAYEEIAINCE